MINPRPVDPIPLSVINAAQKKRIEGYIAEINALKREVAHLKAKYETLDDNGAANLIAITDSKPNLSGSPSLLHQTKGQLNSKT